MANEALTRVPHFTYHGKRTDCIILKRREEHFTNTSKYLNDQNKIFSVRIRDKLYCGKESVIAHFASVERIAKSFATAGYAELIKDFAKQL